MSLKNRQTFAAKLSNLEKKRFLILTLSEGIRELILLFILDWSHIRLLRHRKNKDFRKFISQERHIRTLI